MTTWQHGHVQPCSLTCDGDKGTVLCGASLGDHAQCVEAFIVLVEVGECQGGDPSASFNFHPLRIKEARVCKWKWYPAVSEILWTKIGSGDDEFGYATFTS